MKKLNNDQTILSFVTLTRNGRSLISKIVEHFSLQQPRQSLIKVCLTDNTLWIKIEGKDALEPAQLRELLRKVKHE